MKDIRVIASCTDACLVCKGRPMEIVAIQYGGVQIGGPEALTYCPHCGGPNPPAGFRSIPYSPIRPRKDRKRQSS